MGRHRGKLITRRACVRILLRKRRKRRTRGNDLILLYEAPTGIAIFSVDVGYVDKLFKDFWAGAEHLILQVFIEYARGSTSIDLAERAIEDRLAKTLTMWCRFGNMLIVGRDEYKSIIEEKLEIACLIFHVPDDGVVSSLKNPIHTLLPEEKSEPTKKDNLPMGEVVMFLRERGIDVKPEMVDEKYLVEAAQRLHCIELREKEHLKFLRILLKNFIVNTGIDTTKWSLIQFATTPKLICHPIASYQISHPTEIFSYDEYLEIETNACHYRRSFAKINPLSLYDDVLSLHEENSIILWDLEFLFEDAKKVQEKAVVIRLCGDHYSGEPGKTDLPTTDSYNVEVPSSAEPKQQVIPDQTCIAEGHHCLVPDKFQEKLAANIHGVEKNKQPGDTGVQSMDGYANKPTASTHVLLGNRKDEHTDTRVKEMNLHENMGDDEKIKQSKCTEGIPATNMSSESERDKQKEVNPATIEIPKYGLLKDLNGDGKKPTASTPRLLGKQNGHTGTIEEKTNLTEKRDAGVQSMNGDTTKLAPEGITATNEIVTASMPDLLDIQHNGHTGTIEVKMNLREKRHTGVRSMDSDTMKPEGIPATSEIATASTPGMLEYKQNGHTDPIVENMNLPETRDTCAQGKSGDKANSASSNISNSEQLKGQHTDTSVKKNWPEINGDDANNEKARDDTKVPVSSEIPKFGTLQDQHTGSSVTKSHAISEITSKDEEDNHALEAGVQSTRGDKANPASSDIPNSGHLKGQCTKTSVKHNPAEVNGDDANYEDARDDTKVPATGWIPESGQLKDQHTGNSMTKISEITVAGEEDRDNPASGEIPQSGRLWDLTYEMEREVNEVCLNGAASSVSSQSGNSVVSSGGKTPPYEVDKISRAMKRLCMPFICCLPVD